MSHISRSFVPLTLFALIVVTWAFVRPGVSSDDSMDDTIAETKPSARNPETFEIRESLAEVSPSRIEEEDSKEEEPSDSAELVTIFVCDPSGNPVPDVLASVVCRSELNPGDRLRMDCEPIESWIHELGRPRPVASDGTFLVARVQGRVRLWAENLEFSGEGWLNEEVRGDRQLLTVSPKCSLTVQVVDERGHPQAHVPVFLYSRSRTSDRRGLPDFSGYQLSRQISDDQGDATFSEFGRLSESAHGWRMGNSGELFFCADRWDPNSVFHVDPADLPDEPVQLIAPSHGPLVVEIQYEDGSAVDFPVRIGLTSSEPSFATRDHVVVPPKRSLTLPLPRHRVVTVTGWGTPAISPSKAQTAVPLGTRSREVTLSFPLPTSLLRVTGFLVDQNAEPFANEEFVWGLSAEDAPMLSSKSSSFLGPRTETTDDLGWFDFSADPSLLESPRFLELAVLTGGNGSRTSFASHGMISLSQSVGEVDLGDVVLERAPLIVSGFVMDEAGNPVEGARVRAFPASHPGHQGWHDSCDERGFYSVHGNPPKEPLKASVSGDYGERGGYQGAISRELRSWPAEVDFEVNRVGVASGFLLMDPRVPASAVQFQIKSGRQGVSTSTTVAGSSFTIRGDAGEVTLTLVAFADGTVLKQVPGVVLSAEGSNDSRLQGIDLRGAFRTTDLRVTDPEERPLAGVEVTLSAKGSRFTTNRFGRVTLVTPGHSASAATLSAAFHRGTIVELEHGNQWVVLEPGTRLQLELLPRHVALPDWLRLRLLPDNAPWSESLSRKFILELLEFGPSRAAQITIPHPGGYTMELVDVRDRGLRPLTDDSSRDLQVSKTAIHQEETWLLSVAEQEFLQTEHREEPLPQAPLPPSGKDLLLWTAQDDELARLCRWEQPVRASGMFRNEMIGQDIEESAMVTMKALIVKEGKEEWKEMGPITPGSGMVFLLDRVLEVRLVRLGEGAGESFGDCQMEWRPAAE